MSYRYLATALFFFICSSIEVHAFYKITMNDIINRVNSGSSLFIGTQLQADVFESEELPSRSIEVTYTGVKWLIAGSLEANHADLIVRFDEEKMSSHMFKGLLKADNGDTCLVVVDEVLKVESISIAYGKFAYWFDYTDMCYSNFLDKGIIYKWSIEFVLHELQNSSRSSNLLQETLIALAIDTQRIRFVGDKELTTDPCATPKNYGSNYDWSMYAGPPPLKWTTEYNYSTVNYPEAALKQRENGNVKIKYSACTDGTFGNFEILDEWPIGLGFADAAIQVIKQSENVELQLHSGTPVPIPQAMKGIFLFYLKDYDKQSGKYVGSHQ